MEDNSPLREDEKEVLRKVILSGQDFSKSEAYRYGVRREQWKRICDKLIFLGLARRREGMAIEFDYRIHFYLRRPLPLPNKKDGTS